MKTKRCMNCMEPLDEGMICPVCGYDNNQSEDVPYTLKPNTILHGKYIVGRVLGQGGFGITYMGFDLSLEIKVAIKEYFPMNQTSRDHSVSNALHWNTAYAAGNQWESGCESFLKEARKMAKITKVPEIVSVRETFNENNTAYIIMDFVEGITLKAWLEKNGIMKFDDCVNMLLPLMNALDMVHKQGIIHRDISPDNIMIQPDGRLSLLDLGAAKDISGGNQMASQLVTKHGFSPMEQYMENGEIGPWTDVYALCATIYYCITGKLVPTAPDRLDKNTVLDYSGCICPLTPRQIYILNAGLTLSKDKRTQSVDILMGQLKETVSPRNPQKTGSGKNRGAGKKRFKKFAIAGASVFVLFILLALIAGDDPEVEVLGCSNGNLHQGSNYATIKDKYAYYTDKDWNLYVSSYDKENETFYIGTGNEVVDEEAGFINIGANKIYFIHDEQEDSGYADSLMQMEFDGSGVKPLISDGQYYGLQYVKLTNGDEYLYYLEMKDEAYNLYRYDLKEKKPEKVISDKIFWYNLDGECLYYSMLPDDGSITDIEWKCADLDGRNDKVLNDSDGLFSGYIEDGVAYMFSFKDELMNQYTTDGKKKKSSLKIFNGCSIYADGWIFYSEDGSSKVHRIRPDGKDDTVIFEGENIMDLCYSDNYLWMLQGKEVNDKPVAQQTYMLYVNKFNIAECESFPVEEKYTDTMPADVEYLVEDGALVLVDYTGEDKRIIVPWEVDGEMVSDIKCRDGFPDDVELYVYPQEKEVTYEKNEDGTGVILTGYPGGGKTEGYPYIALPSNVDGLPVVSIGEEVFRDSDTLKGVILPEGMMEIESSAFRDCGQLSYVHLPNTIEKIGYMAFSGTGSLTGMDFPKGLKEIGLYAFLNGGLKQVSLPSTVEKLEGNPFAGWYLDSVSVDKENKNYIVKKGILYTKDKNNRELFTAPVSVTGDLKIDKNIKNIREAAFAYSGITSVVIQGNVQNICANAFVLSKKLKTVEIQDGVAGIGAAAFSGCEALENITIPASVTSIGKEAFKDCPNLRDVTISRNCQVEQDAFDAAAQIHYYP